MLKNIGKNTVAEAYRVSGRMNWDMTLDELDKFIELVIARGILGQRGLPVESLWDTTWAWKVCGIQRVVEKLTGTTPGKILEKMQLHKETSSKLTNLLKKKRKT